MNLSDMITRVADDSNTNSSNSVVNARLIREINRVCSEKWNEFRWSFRWRNYRIVTDTDVITGTVTATNGSRTITGSGTSFSSSHVGWHVYFPGDSILNWYKVRAYTSATQLELDVPYTGTTGGSKTYVLRHFDYVLPTEPWDFGSMVVSANNNPVTILEPFSLELSLPAPLSNGSPEAVAIYSSDSNPTTYSTGSVSGTINTTTMTGSGTLWLSNIYPGDLVSLDQKYTVRSVDSDTQITLYQNLQVALGGGTNYTITRQFGRILRIMWPSAYAYTLDIRALRLYAPLINNNDTNELLYRFPNAVALKAAALELKRQPDKRSFELEKEAELAWARARADDDSLTSRDQIAPIHSYRTR